MGDLRIGLSFDEPEVKGNLPKALEYVPSMIRTDSAIRCGLRDHEQEAMQLPGILTPIVAERRRNTLSFDEALFGGDSTAVIAPLE